MVLQQGQQNPVWGKANAGESVTVSIGDQAHLVTAGDDGTWMVTLDPLPVGGPHTMTVKGSNTITYEDVLIGEVWICSGQSNMGMAVNASNDPDLESLTAKYPNIRLISVPQVGTQEPQDDFKGQWEHCTPASVRNFSAVGYFFGRTLHQALDVPIGLIDNAWGGSAAEAWVRRDLLEKDERYAPLMERWKETEATFDYEPLLAKHEEQMAAFQEAKKAAKAANKPFNRRPPRAPRNSLTGQHRPANLYNGVLKPTIGYGIKGVIWYQGETNASRGEEYSHLFPMMIQHWRDEWKQGDFPFYWVQLADYKAEVEEPGDSEWAELREAQTQTMNKLSNTGEAVIVNLGEANDIHPKNKQDVAKRLARWALAKDYGIDIVYRSPIYKSMAVNDSKAVVTFDHVGGGMDTFDVKQPIGFTIAGEDHKFVHADAKLIGKDKIEVWSDKVSSPVAVRYAWADNPVCNTQNKEGLPLTPFRTDDWPRQSK